MAEKVVINSSRVVQEVSIVSQPNITKVYINNNGGGGANFNLDVSELGDAPINNVNSIVFEGAVVTDLGSRAVKVEISGGGLSLIRQEFSFTSSQIFTLLDDYSQVYSVEVQGQGALSTSQYSLLPPNQVEILDTLDAGDYVVIIYSANTGGVIPYYTQAQVDALLAALPSGAVASVNSQTGIVVLDADDISDASTTNKFITQAGLDKLAGIQAGAEVNVNADWNAVSGDAQILNKPTISGSNTGDVSLAGTPDYITISGQTITRNAIDLATDVTGDLPFANLTQLSAHQVLARAGSGTGDVAGITMGNNTVLGRSGSGDVDDLSATQVRTILNVADGANVGVVPNSAITGDTKTKITYDAKGLVTAGVDATTADIADSTNKRYVTDAQLTVVGNTSGTNTGDNATNSQYSGLAASKEDTANKQTDLTASATKFPTVDAVNTGLATKQKTITSGTSAPSGGVDGDIYLQYI
jgi:hypothetical protein